MKKLLLIGICILIALGIGLGFLLLRERNLTTISMDINPSFMVKVDKKQVLKKIEAINEDAKKIAKEEKLEGKSLKELISSVCKEIKDNPGIYDNQTINVLLHTEGYLNTDKIKKTIEETIHEEELGTNITVIDEITKEDKALAKKYKITPTKAAYINQIQKDNKNVSVKELIEKDIRELGNMQETGYYCPEDYILEGEHCLKEESREPVVEGDICPQEYTMIDNVCYHEGHHQETGNYFCREGETLVDNNCEREATMNAIGVCESGEYRDNLGKCETDVEIGESVEYCRITPGEDLLYNGRCLGRKPTINGGCLGNDVVIDGWCYDTSPTSGYASEWLCPDGSLQSESGMCYKKEFTDVKEFVCEDNSFELRGTTCYRTDTHRAEVEITCEEGYTVYDLSHCIDFNKTAEKTIGNTCPYPSSRLVGDSCIILEDIPALKG